MINPSSSENIDFWAKEEEGKQDHHYDIQSSKKWSVFQNPRIVRVSRAFGGKDRHSKVCTVRGLRDRRIRLSVPTAVEIYDLQHKLGLSQPSKVIDWLIEVTKHDIDELPPLQLPFGFGGFPFVRPPETLGSSLSPFVTNNLPFLRHGFVHEALFSEPISFWDGDNLSREKGKEVERFDNQTTSNEESIIGNHNMHVSGLVGNFLPAMSNLSQFGIMSQNIHQNPFIANNDTSLVPGSHDQLCFSQLRHPFAPLILPPYATTNSLVIENNLQPLFSCGSNRFMPPFHLAGPPLKPLLDGENHYKVHNQGSHYQ